MNNIDEIKDKLISEINELPCIKRLHELESIIDKNTVISEKFNHMKDVQKKLVNSKHYGKENAYIEYSKELELIKEEISNIPFVEEYLDLLDEAYNMLINISKIMTEEINKNI